MNIFYVEILDLLPGNQHHAQIQLIHHLALTYPKKWKLMKLTLIWIKLMKYMMNLMRPTKWRF